MSETVAFIPARKGSKRLPRKNVLPFHGRPLAWWTLDLARRCEMFDRIWLSSDDEEVVALAGDGVTVVPRPPELADDTATILQVLLHTARAQGLGSDARIAVLMVTGPLRVMSDLTEGLRLFEAHGGRRTVVSVGPNPNPPALLWHAEPDGTLSPLEPRRRHDITRKQSHRPTYIANDVLVIDSLAGFLVPGRDLFGPSPVALMIPEERAVAIDTPFQFRLAETLFPPGDERHQEPS